MNYLQNKSAKNKKYFGVAFIIVFIPVLYYFGSGIFNGFAYVGHKLFSPFLVFGNQFGEKFSGVNSFFASKNSLYRENADLKSKLDIDRLMMANYNSVISQNSDLKEILGRKEEKTSMTIAAILGKPNQSLYDTIIIDAGTKEGINKGNKVFALGNVPIGRVSDVYADSSKVILFSSPGEKTQVEVSPGPGSEGEPAGEAGKNVFMEAVGRGGGNFEVILPRDFTPEKGDQVVLPGLAPYVLGAIETIISDPRDSFIKALLVSPVNVQELKFVQVGVSVK